MRSVTGLPDNDRDSDTVSGRGAFEKLYVPAHPLGRELSAEETASELRRIVAKLQQKLGARE